MAVDTLHGAGSPTIGAADTSFMRRARRLAERGRCTAAPNPWVGCVLVANDGQVVGEGYHRRAGEPHAESWSLVAAGPRARGATAYVTLEPCAHTGRTPPCVDALIEAGISRVVIGVLDPDPRVAGRGVDRLRSAAIRVDVGVDGESVAQSLAPYLHQRRTDRAYCVVKAAISLDGRTAAADGSSHWITGPSARADAHALRGRSQAILVGAGTALVDSPALTVRDTSRALDRQPLRVLLDGRGRAPARGPLFDLSLAPTLVVTLPSVDSTTQAGWLSAGAEVVQAPPMPDGSLDLRYVLELLSERGVLQVLVEGGPVTAGRFVRAGLANTLVLYVGGLTLGESGRPLLAGAGPLCMAEAGHWRLLSARRFGPDMRLDYAPEVVD